MNRADQKATKPNIVDWLGYLSIVSMPVVALANLVSVFHIGSLSIRATDILFLLSSALCGAKLILEARSESSLRTYIQRILGLVTLSVLGILLLHNSVDWPKYLRFVQTMLWGALSLAFMKEEKHFKKLTDSVVFVGVFMSSTALYLHFRDPDLQRIAGYMSFAGGEGLEGQASFNDWGAFYVLVLTILLWRSYQGVRSVSHVMALGVVSCGLLLVQSRSALVALSVVVLFLAVLWIRKLLRERARKLLWAHLLLPIFLLAFMVIASDSLALNRFSETFVTGSSADLSVTIRFLLWQRSAELWTADILRFLLGYGSAAFTNLIDSPTADNFYLDHGVSEGFLGLILILRILVTPVLKLRRNGLLNNHMILATLVVAVALIVSVTGNVLVDPTYGGVTFILLYGIVSIHSRECLPRSR